MSNLHAAGLGAPSTTGPVVADRLWMAAREKGRYHHRLPATSIRAGCGQYAGPDGLGEDGWGAFVSAAATRYLGSPPCLGCWRQEVSS